MSQIQRIWAETAASLTAAADRAADLQRAARGAALSTARKHDASGELPDSAALVALLPASVAAVLGADVCATVLRRARVTAHAAALATACAEAIDASASAEQPAAPAYDAE